MLTNGHISRVYYTDVIYDGAYTKRLNTYLRESVLLRMCNEKFI